MFPVSNLEPLIASTVLSSLLGLMRSKLGGYQILEHWKQGELPAIRGAVRTKIWYDPCGLLGSDGPSELKPEYRKRVQGGGWCYADPGLE